jgi:uncharacterized membrane protein YgdD (TMEM256/DUF423 family)
MGSFICRFQTRNGWVSAAVYFAPLTCESGNLQLCHSACYHSVSSQLKRIPATKPLTRMKYPYLFFAAINGFLVVAIGAFGAHALDGRINVVMLDVYDTAVRYQMFHTVAFVATHLLARELPQSACRTIGRLFIAGILLFCGSLYLLAITSVTWLGMITPIGGILLLAGWFLLARACYKSTGA